MVLDPVREFLQGVQGLVKWCSYGGRKIRSSTARREVSSDSCEGFGGALHHIMPATAVYVHVDKSWCEDCVAKVNYACCYRYADVDAGPNRGYDAILDNDNGIADSFQRRDAGGGGENDLHDSFRFRIVAEWT